MYELTGTTVPMDISSPRLNRQVLRAALGLMVACALLASPAEAFAKRASSDQIAGRPLAESDLPRKVAPDVSASSAALSVDGRVLWSRRVDEKRAMASTTKIMTALLALERSDPRDMVKISKKASKVPYALGLRAGERRSVQELLELALITSSNDAATALAEHVSGSVPAFVATMNRRAAELDLESTRFANPHGLDAPGHGSSAADLARLSGTAMKLPEFRRIVARKKVTLPAYKDRPKRKLKNTNQLLREYPGAVGGKTGFTNDAKYSLVTVAERDGVALTAVVLGAPDSATRFKTSKKLLNWGFKHFSVQTVASPSETVGSVPFAPDPSRSVPARFAEKTKLPVFDLDGPISKDVQLSGALRLPVFEGQPVGTARILQGENVLATVDLVAAADVASVGETVGSVPVADYLNRSVTVRAAESSSAVEAFDAGSPVKRTVNLDRSVNAPVAKGTPLGEIVYSQGGKVLCRVPAVAADGLKEPGAVEKFGISVARSVLGVFGAQRMASMVIADS